MARAWKATSAGTYAALLTVALATGCSSRARDGSKTADGGVPAKRGAVFYVDGRADGGGDGRTWGTALRFITDALSVASVGDTIRVAEGRDRPDQSEENPDGTLDRSA